MRYIDALSYQDKKSLQRRLFTKMPYKRKYGSYKKSYRTPLAVSLAKQAERHAKTIEFNRNLANQATMVAGTLSGGEGYSDQHSEYQALKNEKAMERMVGRGAYSMGDFRRDMGSLGKIVGRPILDALQNATVKGINKFSGSGLYSGRGAYNNLFPSEGRPSMQVSSPNDEKQTICISNTEYLQDVYGPANATFTNNTLFLNPGLLENFPFLAQLASNYEEYEFVQLVFSYRTTVDPSATNNTTGATGTVIMATNYDATAPAFTNKETMMNYHGAQSGRLTDDHVHGVECEPFANQGTPTKYVRSLPLAGNTQSLTNYDWGTFQIAFVNTPSAFFNQQIGELWVSYTVKLSKPKLYCSLANNSLEFRQVSFGGESASSMFGTNPLTMVKQGIAAVATTNLGPYTSGTTQSFLFVTLPDFLTGVIELQFFLEGTGFVVTGIQSPVASGSYQWVKNCLTGSNVTPFNDILASEDTLTSDSPTYLVKGGTATQTFILGRFNVQPATAGVDNVIGFVINWTSAPTSVTQAQLILRQTCGVLITNSTTACPLYQNSSGIIVSPY